MNVWELIIQQPLTNVLIVISHAFGGNFGVAIIILTIVVNLLLLPLTLTQIKSSKKMQELQPELAKLQKQYAKDREKLAKEQMALYKRSGVKPAGCALTMIIQMPVWLALYQSVMLALAAVPEGLLNLARYLYPWDIVFSSLPMSPYFLGMDLASPNIVLAILVGVTMWLQQKMSTTPTDDPRSMQQSQLMTWMMPLLFTFMALTFPAGLSLYWVTSSIFRIVLQYRISGWGSLRKHTILGTDPTKDHMSFKTPKTKEIVVKPKEEVAFTDKESLKKHQKSGFFGRFKLLQGGDKDQPEQQYKPDQEEQEDKNK